jgi:hypothetical protein
LAVRGHCHFGWLLCESVAQREPIVDRTHRSASVGFVVGCLGCSHGVAFRPPFIGALVVCTSDFVSGTRLWFGSLLR